MTADASVSQISNRKSEIGPDVAASTTAATALPHPLLERWQPLRSGVLNLYRYDYEEFHYEQGRLLLRGNNGSGKSRVLALQLPFLLDGEVSPARVEPDGDAAKRIEWNLLMGRYHDRTGYTWIEFGRREADGTTHFLTLGCGLRAVSGHTGLHSRWFFTTTQRIGRDLFLQNQQHTPLGRERLTEAVGVAGHVYQKAEDYRRAVDDALFGLGPRYSALIELLLRLRRPQLTRKLDENELPDALSDALPTLSSAIVDEVAESFRSLQADKDTVRDFNSAREAVATFLREYAVYVRIAVRRRAAVVRTTHSAYEHAQRAVKEATQRLETATTELTSLALQHTDLNTRLAVAETDERTLANSPEMRTAEEIRLAGDTAQTAEKNLADAQADERSAASAADQALSRQNIAEENSAAFEQKCASSLQAASVAATAADLAADHTRYFPAISDAQIPDFKSHVVGEAGLNHVLAQRGKSITLLITREKRVADSVRLLTAAEEILRHAESAATAAREDEHSARGKLEALGTTLFSSYTSWHASSRHLKSAEPSSLAEAFDLWLERRDGPGPLRRATENAHHQATAEFAASESTLKRIATDLTQSIAELDTEMVRLENGETLPPPPPFTRRADRTDRPGAPLWRVCDFRSDVTTADRAGFEAALQSSGLLDAWVLPDGRLLSTEEDTFLFSAGSESQISNSRSQITSRLSDVLAPAIDPESPVAKQLSAETVARLLSSVGSAAGESSHWVARDGTWRLGPLSGRWSKPEADFLGESNRAAARRRQLGILHARRAETNADLLKNRATLAALTENRLGAAAEFAAAPSEQFVIRAGYDLEAAALAVTTTLTAAERAAQNAANQRSECEQHRKTLQIDAADLHLAGWLGRLEDLADATHHYATLLAALWPTLRHGETIAAQLAAVREQSDATQTHLVSRRQRRTDATLTAASARQHFKTLQETHGQAVAVILGKHTAAKAAVVGIKIEISANEAERIKQTTAHARAEENQNAAEEKRVEQETLRRNAIASLRQLAAQRLLADADPALREHDAEEEWSVARAVDIARAIDGRLTDTPADNDSWQQRQEKIHSHIQELRDRLITRGHPPETHQIDEIVLVRCLFQARPHTMTELHTAFSAEIEARERLLQAREREIIENHLLAEAAVELQKLIRAAEAWRASANEELHSRPTSTGVRFRFQWEADTEIRFHEVRPILLRKGELWNPAERIAVATFLQGRIAAEQTADDSGSWRDHLARALDYRRWHRFVIERQQDGQWRRLNKTTYGTGSGGEKALALTLPRFAAAAAHYRGAAATAPRLVMLDEAFAGIDPTMRAQCLGVLTQFDLDVVMTSELEWGCYTTVPALAIYHLTTLPGLEAVGATRWIWNGREKRQLDHPEPQAISADSAETESTEFKLSNSPSSAPFPPDAPAGGISNLSSEI